MINKSGYDEKEFHYLYTRLLHQKINAFFCVTCNSILLQREIAAEIQGLFPAGGVQVIDFKNIGNDFLFTSQALKEMLAPGVRILFLVNFQLAGGDLPDEDFLQIVNLSRDNLAEMPQVFVFMMPLYFRIKIARKAPDFNSFFQYHADFSIPSEPLESIQKISDEPYSPADKELLEYYLEKYGNLKDYNSQRAFEIVLKILDLNKSLRVLHFAELNRFFAEFKRLLQKYEGDLDDFAFEIAAVFASQGDYPNALKFYMKDLAISENVLGKEHPDTTATYNNMAGVYRAQGDYDKALLFYEKDLAICEKVLGKEHPSTAATYNNMAIVYEAQGDYDKALLYYEKALAIKEKVLGKEHPSTADTYNNMAIVYQAQGDYDKALLFCEKALAIKEKVLGKEHSSTAYT
ncbi:MAG: tetratricopeptide repeat-containing protein, partial [Clostridiales bacterium]|nr:tetratricopeptide repeat-containing protein [Clostridiales bacterium]